MLSRDLRPGLTDEEDEEEAEAEDDLCMASSAPGSDPGGNGRAPEKVRMGSSGDKKSIELRGSYSAGSVWHAPVAQEGVFCGRRFRWRCGSEVGLDERDDDPAVKEDALSLVLKIK